MDQSIFGNSDGPVLVPEPPEPFSPFASPSSFLCWDSPPFPSLPPEVSSWPSFEDSRHWLASTAQDEDAGNAEDTGGTLGAAAEGLDGTGDGGDSEKEEEEARGAGDTKPCTVDRGAADSDGGLQDVSTSDDCAR